MKTFGAMQAVLAAVLSMVGMAAVSQTSQADVLFEINNGAAVPAFSYGSAVGSNNVINAAGAPATGSTVTDTTGGSTSEWLGTASGGPSSFISVAGLVPGQGYLINWQYIGSESGDVVQISIPGLPTFSEDNRNNNFTGDACCTGVNPSLTKNLGTINYTSNGIDIPVFTLKDLTTLGTVTNGGPNPAPNTNVASLIFAYATRVGGGLFELTDHPTDFIVFGFNDNGTADDNHDDFMGVMLLIQCGGNCGPETPIPGALPLFGSVLGGALGLLGWRRKRRFFNKDCALLLAAGLVLIASVNLANALTFAFSFSDDPTDVVMPNHYGRTHVPGTVTGFIFGLQNNTNSQIPTLTQITSDQSAFGIVGNVFSPVLVLGTGLDVLNNQIVAANLLFNFDDTLGHEFQIRFNYADPGFPAFNWLLVNGGGNPDVGTGNTAGFAGATFVATPLPVTLPLFVTGLGALGLLGWRRKRRA